MGFWRKDAFEGLQHVFPANNTRNEKLRKIGRLLVNMAKDELIVKSSNGKKWLITVSGSAFIPCNILPKFVPLHHNFKIKRL